MAKKLSANYGNVASKRRVLMKRLAVVLLLMVIPLAAFAAYSADHPKIGLILATGGLGDKSFNDQAIKNPAPRAQGMQLQKP